MTTEKAVNREIQRNQRAKYMNHGITHHEYYRWLALFIGVNKGYLPVSTERIRESTDEHLNDIPLSLWDGCDPNVRRLAYKKGLSWSLSDSVCVLKTMARVYS